MLASMIRRLGRDARGNVTILAALSLIPILAVVGLAIDFQLVQTQIVRVQTTIDAAVIAGARARQEGATDTQIAAIVNEQFYTLLAANAASVDCGVDAVNVVVNDVVEDVDADVTCRQPTLFSFILDETHDEFVFHVASGATFGIGEVDVAFVFDVSGSMDTELSDDPTRTRLEALQTAAIAAFDQLLPTDWPTNDDVRISLVAYNGSVNAGGFFDAVTERLVRPGGGTSEFNGDVRNANIGRVFIDQGSGLRFFDYESVSGSNDFAARRAFPNNTCVVDRLGTEALSDERPDAGDPVSAGNPYWDYREDEPDNTFNLDQKDAAHDEVESTTNILDYRRRNSFRRFENVPGVGNVARWIFDPVPAQCPSSGPQPLTHNRNTLVDYVNALSARGQTAGQTGLAWGWYLISPNWSSIWPFDAQPHAYDAPDTAKALVLMTDGSFNQAHPATGRRSVDIAADLCDAIKANTNIVIYTVAFDVPDDAATTASGETITDFCASGDDFSFDASTGAELLDSFQSIATSISDLRLAR